ncbi:FUSC family protein [Fusibacter bizertensis]
MNLSKIAINKIGMRNIKTGIAVTITLLICELLKVTNPFYAAIAAIFAMESSIEATFVVVRDRMYGTVLGALVALLFVSFFPVNPLTIGVGIIVVIYICNLFKWQGTIKITTIVFLAISLGVHGGDNVSYAFFRTIDTFIGLSISALVNVLIYPIKKTS